METKVKLSVNQEIPASDLNAMQDFAEESIDTIVRELLFSDPKYLGMAVVANSSLEIAIGGGYFINDGAVYRKAASTTANLTSLLPSSNYRKCLVVATGEEVETETSSRRFLLDPVTRETQPRSVATRVARNAITTVIAGVASANPSRPAVGSGYVVVAEFTIGPSGITVDPVMETANEADSLQEAMDNVALLKAQDAKHSAMMETMRSEIAGLAAIANSKADKQDFSHLVGDVLEMRDRLDVKDTMSFWGQDSFNDAADSDEAFSGYTARIEGGALQMGWAENFTALIALANANDPKLDITESGLILPKSTSEIRIAVDNITGSVAIGAHAVTTVAGQRKKHSSSYIFYATKPGREFMQALLSSSKTIRVRKAEDNSLRTLNLSGKRYELRQIADSGKKGWEIQVSEPYWEEDTVEVSTTGARLGQTLVCSQGGWHKRIDFRLTDVAATGNLRIKICELTEDGQPDLQHIIADTTINVDDLVENDWSRADFDPFYLRRGRRYAIVITTSGNHTFATAPKSGLTSGTLFVQDDAWTDLGVDLAFRLYGCTFASQRVVIDIDSLTLSGGIRELSAIISGHRPSGTKLTIQGKYTGGVWRNLSSDDDTVLSTAPNQLQLRLVFQGTKDLMPAIDLTRSRLVVARPLTTSVHISTVRTLGLATADEIIVRQVSRDFVEADHDWTVQILHGASYATAVSASSVLDRVRKDGAKLRTWVFAVPAISSYRIKTTLVASSANNTMSVGWRRDEADAS